MLGLSSFIEHMFDIVKLHCILTDVMTDWTSPVNVAIGAFILAGVCFVFAFLNVGFQILDENK